MTDKCELLINAALENNLEKIKSLIEQDSSLLSIAFDDQDKTLLHIATQKGYLELVQYIVEKNPQLISKVDKAGNYPLHYAVENGYEELTLAILQADKMAINLLDKNNSTPLDIAIEKDDGQVITKIIEICPELLDKEDQEGNIPLYRAINKAKAVSVRVILEANPKAIFYKNKDQSPPLSPILLEDSQDVSEILEESDTKGWKLSEIPEANLTDIEKTETIRIILETHPQVIQVRNEGGKTLAHTVATGQNAARRKLAIEIFEKYPNARLQQDNQGNTPLHIAIQHNNTQVAKIILLQGIDILEIYNKEGRNALHLATECRNYELVKSILEVANLDLVKKGTNDAESLNCLHLAAQRGYDDIVELILSRDQSLTKITALATKSTALHIAVFHCHLDVMKTILKRDPDSIKIKNNDNLTPFDIAINKPELDMVEYIIKHNKDEEFIVNALRQKQNLNGLTILHTASIKGHLGLVEAILEKDKDLIQATDAFGLTPFDLAITDDNISVIKSILKYNKEAFLMKNALGHRAAHSAVILDKLRTLKVILSSYPQTDNWKVSLKDLNGSTLLHYAAAQGHLEIVKYLVKEGLGINDINIQQDSPLHLAAQSGHGDVVQYLYSIGADINLKNQADQTPIYNAIENGHIEVVESILEKILGNDSEFIITSGKHLLAKAIESGQTRLIDYLIADKNVIHPEPMHLAIKSGHLNVIELLENYGYAINSKNRSTFVHLAAENGKLNVLTSLATKDPSIITVKDHNHNSLLYSATVGGNLETIQYLAKQGLDITAPNPQGSTLLHLASSFGHTNVIQYLMRQEQFAGNLDIKDNQGDTPLGLSVKNGHLKIVKLLLKQGANIDTQNNAGYRIIHLAVISNSVELLSYLFDQGIKLDTPSKDELLPLHLAAIEGKVKVIQFFRKKGLDINQPDNKGLKPFDLAVKNGHLELVKWYLKECNDVNISSYNSYSQSLKEKPLTESIQPSLDKKSDNSVQNTPLHLAAQKGYLHAAKLLIERGTAINAFNRDKNTPLHLAVQNGHTVVIQELLSKDANPQLRNKAGKIPLDLAQGKQEIVDLLTISNTTSQETDGSQASAQEQTKEISSISHKKNKKSTQNLAKKETNDLKTTSKTNIDIKPLIQDVDNTLDSQSNTSLHLSAMRGNVEKIKQLLDEVDTRSKINAQNKDGFTALHLAVQNGHLGAVEALLGHGAENTQNKKGNYPLHFAAKSGHLEIAKLLVQKGAEVKTSNKRGNTPLHLASQKDHIELVLLFLQNGAEINALNNNDNNPLHLAIQNGSLRIVELLLENGVDTTTVNKDSKTALDLAIASGNQEVVAILKNSKESAAEKASKQEILESKDVFLTKTPTPLQKHITPPQINIERPVGQMIRQKSAFELFKRGIDLHQAAKIGYLDAIDIISKVGVDVNALNFQGHTPLYLAIFCNQYHSAQKLLQNGAKVEAPYPHGFNLLHLAIHLDKSKHFIKLLSDYAVDIEAKDTMGNTAGHLAALKGRGEVLSVILDKRANINAKNKLGDTWLHVAVIYGHKNVINLLLDQGADINDLNFQRQTTLSLAIDYNKMAMATELIKKGAKAGLIDFHKAMDFCMPENFIKSLVNTLEDVNVKGKDGYTAGHLASSYGLKGVLDCLLKRGANLHSLNDFGDTWLHVATMTNQNSTIQFLLGKGAKQNAKDFAGNTPLHYAKTVETVKLLIKSGADYTACNRQNFTPLDMAILNPSPEVILELTKYKPQNSGDYPDARSLYMSQDRPSIISKPKPIIQESKKDNIMTKTLAQFIPSHETSLKSMGVSSDETHPSPDKTYEHTEEVKSLGEELDINI